MKILKKILLFIGILIAFVLISALLIRKDIKVEKEIVINKPKQEVFNYLTHLRNQNNFSTYCMKDLNMRKEYRGTEGSAGSVFAWDGNNDVGKGEQEITKITGGEKIDIVLRFHEPMESQATAWFVTEDLGNNQTKVKWGMKGDAAYPFNFLQLFNLFDNMIGKEYQESLNNLKATLEK